MPFFKHKEIFLTKNIPRLVFKIDFRYYFVFKVRNTSDNLTLTNKFSTFTVGGCTCWYRGGDLLPP